MATTLADFEAEVQRQIAAGRSPSSAEGFAGVILGTSREQLSAPAIALDTGGEEFIGGEGDSGFPDGGTQPLQLGSTDAPVISKERPGGDDGSDNVGTVGTPDRDRFGNLTTENQTSDQTRNAFTKEFSRQRSLGYSQEEAYSRTGAILGYSGEQVGVFIAGQDPDAREDAFDDKSPPPDDTTSPPPDVTPPPDDPTNRDDPDGPNAGRDPNELVESPPGSGTYFFPGDDTQRNADGSVKRPGVDGPTGEEIRAAADAKAREEAERREQEAADQRQREALAASRESKTPTQQSGFDDPLFDNLKNAFPELGDRDLVRLIELIRTGMSTRQAADQLGFNLGPAADPVPLDDPRRKTSVTPQETIPDISDDPITDDPTGVPGRTARRKARADAARQAEEDENRESNSTTFPDDFVDSGVGQNRDGGGSSGDGGGSSRSTSESSFTDPGPRDPPETRFPVGQEVFPRDDTGTQRPEDPRLTELIELFTQGGITDEAGRIAESQLISDIQEGSSRRRQDLADRFASVGVFGGRAQAGIGQVFGESERGLATGIADVRLGVLEAQLESRGRALEALLIQAGLSSDEASLMAQLETQKAIEEARIQLGQDQLQTTRDLGFGELDLQEQLGNRELDLGFDTLDTSRELGFGRLDLDRDLGFGSLANEAADDFFRNSNQARSNQNARDVSLARLELDSVIAQAGFDLTVRGQNQDLIMFLLSLAQGGDEAQRQAIWNLLLELGVDPGSFS